MSDVFEFIQSNVHDHDVKKCVPFWKHRNPATMTGRKETFQAPIRRKTRKPLGFQESTLKTRGSMVRPKFIRFLLAVARACP